MSRLQQIQVTTQQMADAISSVLGMDVTIVDETMVRIAGTGHHTKTIGKSITGNSVYDKVIRQAQEYFIDDVSTYNDCGKCDKRATCMELAQLCCPIILGKEAIGIIGLIAFTPEQQLELQNKGEYLLTFIRKMAEFIAAKVAEREGLNRMLLLKNQVETVLNFAADGILAIDNTANIINVNAAAEQLLGIRGTDVIGFHMNEIFPGTPIPEVLRDGTGFMNREVSVWHKGKHHHYLISAKPMTVDGVVQGVVATFRTEHIYQGHAARNETQITFEQILGNSSLIEKSKQDAQKAAGCKSTVLILGESGTGKEVFAKAIHAAGDRRNKPFVAINCAAIPEHLLESEMFGYEEGSFTGAKKGGKLGKFQLADGGTLFLDEIGDMPLALQAKMLRVLQEKVVEQVGSLRFTRVDVRIIAATHRNLEQMVRDGEFREDLYYRLNVYQVLLPPLRECRSDIRVLAEHFLGKHAENHIKNISGFSTEALQILLDYRWPGNVRELENAIECAVIKALGPWVEGADLPSKILHETGKEDTRCAQGTPTEKEMIEAALQTYGRSVQAKQQAAEKLGIGIATLYRKIRKYGIQA